MLKNTIRTAVKDEVLADNSGLSSNQIEELASDAHSLIIDDTSEGSDDTTYSSNKILSLIRGV